MPGVFVWKVFHSNRTIDEVLNVHGTNTTSSKSKLRLFYLYFIMSPVQRKKSSKMK